MAAPARTVWTIRRGNFRWLDPNEGGGSAMQASAVLVGSLLAAAAPNGCELLQPGGPPHDPPPTAANPVSWHTRTVSLTADDFWIDIEGKRFTARVTPVSVSGDPGHELYTSLEIEWHEHGREMRLFIYLRSDGNRWWTDEIRTYDGRDPSEWVYYYGRQFDTPLGQPFVGDVELVNNGPEDRARAILHFRGLKLSTRFRSPAP
jgi:hypothetical protein